MSWFKRTTSQSHRSSDSPVDFLAFLSPLIFRDEDENTPVRIDTGAGISDKNKIKRLASVLWLNSIAKVKKRTVHLLTTIYRHIGEQID